MKIHIEIDDTDRGADNSEPWTAIARVNNGSIRSTGIGATAADAVANAMKQVARRYPESAR